MRAIVFVMVGACACSDDGARVVEDARVETDALAETDARADADALADSAADADALADAGADADEDAVVVVDWPTACVAGDSDTVPVPEASGAVRLDDGRVLVVADSGNGGRAAIVDFASGESVAVTMPLGGAGDDIEDLTRAPDGTIWGLSSAGWLHAWSLDGEVVTRANDPTPIADEGDWRCAIDGVNCAANYEGFCLHPAPDDHCVGWAASKARGLLVCVVADGDSYRIDPATTIAVAPADQLSGCDYEPVPPYRLIVAGNLESDSTLWQVDGTTVSPFRVKGIGNQEAVLVTADGRIHSFGDLQEILPDSSPHQVLDCSTP